MLGLDLPFLLIAIATYALRWLTIGLGAFVTILGLDLPFLLMATAMYASQWLTIGLGAFKATFLWQLVRPWLFRFESWLFELGFWRPTPTRTISPLPTPSTSIDPSMTWSWMPLLLFLAFLALVGTIGWAISTTKSLAKSQAAVRSLLREKASAETLRIATETATAGSSAEIARLQNANRTLHEESMKASDLQEQYETLVPELFDEIACLQEHINAKKAVSETQSKNVERDNLDSQSAKLKERLEAALEAKYQEVESLHSYFKEKIDLLKGEIVDTKEELRDTQGKLEWSVREREMAEKGERTQIAEADDLRKQLANVKEELANAKQEHTTETRHLQLRLVEAVAARDATEVAVSTAGDVVTQGITGSGHRPTEAQPAVEAEVEASGSASTREPEEQAGEDERGENEGKGEVKGKKKARRFVTCLANRSSFQAADTLSQGKTDSPEGEGCTCQRGAWRGSTRAGNFCGSGS